MSTRWSNSITLVIGLALGTLVLLALGVGERKTQDNVTNVTEDKPEVVKPDLTGTVKPGQIYVKPNSNNPFIGSYKIFIREVRMGGDGLYISYSFMSEGEPHEGIWSCSEENIISGYKLEPLGVTNVTVEKEKK